MITARYTALAAALLTLGACGDEPEADREGEGAPSAPLGFELALAGMGGGVSGSGSGYTAAPDTTPGPGPAPAPAPMIIDLSPEQLAARIKAGNVRLIDVRTDAEVAEGVIPGAEHIALDQFDPASLDLSDGREVVLYCRSGRRSAIAGEALAAVTGKPVEHLAGGIIAWDAAQQPIAPR